MKYFILFIYFLSPVAQAGFLDSCAKAFGLTKTEKTKADVNLDALLGRTKSEEPSEQGSLDALVPTSETTPAEAESVEPAPAVAIPSQTPVESTPVEPAPAVAVPTPAEAESVEPAPAVAIPSQTPAVAATPEPAPTPVAEAAPVAPPEPAPTPAVAAAPEAAPKKKVVDLEEKKELPSIPAGDKTFHLAIMEGKDSTAKKVVAKMIKNGVDIDGLFNGLSPLHMAALLGKPHFIEALLEAGAKIGQKTFPNPDAGFSRQTPLELVNNAILTGKYHKKADQAGVKEAKKLLERASI